MNPTVFLHLAKDAGNADKKPGRARSKNKGMEVITFKSENHPHKAARDIKVAGVVFSLPEALE